MESLLTSPIAREEEKLLACIHCGLCLEACPTYVITGDENDGPRGRLYLMRAVGEGRLAPSSASFERHIDRCLGCRACEMVCPAGVEYGQLLEAARSELFQVDAKRGLSYRLLRFVLKHVWLHPARLRFAFAVARFIRDSGLAGLTRKTGLGRLLSKRFEFATALLESSAKKTEAHPTPANVVEEKSGSASGVMLFTGCVGAGLFARVNEATVRVLQANGFAVVVPRDQICCGALHAHAGDLEGAQKLARQNITAFESKTESAAVITNAGGCGAMLRSYEHLLAGDPEFAGSAAEFSQRVRDVSQQLETVAMKRVSNSNTPTVTYDASCHLLYGQGAGQAPLKMLEAAGVNLMPLEGSDRCCGGAGIYNLMEPDLSGKVLEQKLAHIQATDAKIVATGNPGCQMQIGAGATLAGMHVSTCHPVELLDEAYACAGFYTRGDQDN
ncbi:MAG TPA: heterodisulfide reductase-related iron-sulfur binding cluster [Pyrinomonadaceae bacterium]|nr:heterodisulfide reductase-related iron-sulfur binding cluster [Pyrinomonadaceae bacterium]